MNAQPRDLPPRPRSDADPIDIQVGLNVRLIRRAAGKSQTWLAEQLGLTFQQIQKYERGFNRISASRLLKTAWALDVGVLDLFAGAETASDHDGAPVTPSPQPAHIRAALTKGPVLKIVADCASMNARQLASIASVARAIAAANALNAAAGEIPY